MTPRRRRGTITPYRLADGTTRYQVRAPLPPDPRTGARRREQQTAATRDEAERLLARMLVGIDDGIVVDPSRATVADLARQWLEEDAATRLKPTTIDGYRQTIEKHLLTRPIAKKRAQTLTPADVSAFRAALLRETGQRTAELAFLRLKQILAWAASLELVKRNVAEALTIPAKAAPERRALTHAEARRFLKEAESDIYHPLWLLYLSTGLRRGEGLGLRWRDLDLDRGLLSVRQQVVLAGKPAQPTIQTPKSKAALRTIEIDDALIIALESHRETQAAVKAHARHWWDHGLVFCTRHGRPHNPNNVLGSFAVIREKAGLGDDVTVHVLRHTHATHLILAGVPIPEVSKRLGHARVSTTMDLYAHLLSDYRGSSVDVVRRTLHGHDVPALEG